VLSQTTFHEAVLGAGFLVVLIAIVVLVALSTTIPAELWTMEGAIFGVLTGTQLPSPAQRQQLARQSDQMTTLVNTVATMHSPNA
jgi:hypothetical protein